MASLKEVVNKSELDVINSEGRSVVLHFWASWCEPCKHMDTVMAQLAKDYPSVSFLRVEAEAVEEVTAQYDVSMVPYFVMLQGGVVVDKVEGADPAALSDKAAALAARKPVAAPQQQQPQDVQGRIKWLLTQNPVLLFMKGTADAPVCGFSGKVVAALKGLQVPFKTVDILSDNAVREGLKEYSNWPTYPQLYVKGELVGGCDIVLQMQASGELSKLFTDKLGPSYQTPPAGASAAGGKGPAPAAPVAVETKEQVQARLKQLVSSSPVMLFMKGTPQEPRCGFSRKVVDALKGIDVQFGSFDILSDNAVREGLKEYSNWPTYPQLYVAGELMGGCDIVLQMQSSGELKPTIESELSKAKEQVQARLKQLVSSSPVMLFMKGTPQEPRCGFSRKVASALSAIDVQFGSFDILSDNAVREGLKEYSNWPTYPQLYVKGELMGGCDIVLQMQESGELKTTINEMLHRMDTA